VTASSPSLRLFRARAPRAAAFLVAAALVITATYVVSWRSQSAVPATDVGTSLPPADTIPMPLPAGDDPAAAPGLEGRLSLNDRIAFWTARIERHPRDIGSMLNLVTVEMAKARLTADLDLYQRASGVLDRAAAIAPTFPWARQLRAALAYTLHDFVAAEATARALVAQNAGDVASRGILADALVELGRYDEAAALYEALWRDAPGPALDVRLARFAYLRGEDARAIGLATSARDAALADPTVNDAAFYDFQLAEMARLTGRADVAATAYDAALAVRPRDLGSLVGLARVQASEGAIDAAIGHLEEAAAIAPQAETLALLGDLRAASGRPDLAKAQYDTVRAISGLSAIAGSIYDRQLLLFELDHGGATAKLLSHAEDALERRADIFGWDAVAWARYRLGNPAGAQEAMARAMATGCTDARLLYHAGAIRLVLGDGAAAARLLGSALGLGPALDPAQRTDAAGLFARALADLAGS
jgi:tetratricopeptide (TPR) repeat protein